MASPISTGSHPKLLWPGLHELWGRTYNSHGEQHKDLFDVKSSDAINYVSEQQGTVTRATHVTYGQGYQVTEEEQEDNLYEQASRTRIEANAFALYTTLQTVAANVYNRAADSGYTFGDGVEILSTAHPTLAGDQSNELATAADLTETSLEDIVIQMMNTKNTRGNRIALKPRCLIVAPGNWFNANRILTSALQNDSANNSINVLRNVGSIPEGIKVNNYLTDADAWYVRSDCPAGLTMFDRRPVTFAQDNAFDTGNLKAKATFRVSFTIGDWRAIFGSMGA
jgi:hypothetical protein